MYDFYIPLLNRCKQAAAVLAVLVLMAACATNDRSASQPVVTKPEGTKPEGTKPVDQKPVWQPKTAFDRLQDSAPGKIPRGLENLDDAVPAPVKRTRVGNKSPYIVRGKSYRVLASSAGFRQRGLASWYGKKFHGRKTSNGETYDMFAMTAAHKTLPIPAYVRVTNLDNGRSVVVRVNDRGPFHSDRIIDLSYAAATKLGYVNRGTARVEVVDVTPAGLPKSSEQAPLTQAPLTQAPLTQSPLKQAPFPHAPKPQVLDNPVWLQVGAFTKKDAALALERRVSGRLARFEPKAPVQVVSGSDAIHRVRIGPLSSSAHIERLKQALVELGIQQAYRVSP